jgi:FkbM family methyltransferase
MAEMVKAKLNGKYEIILPKHRAERPEWYTDAGWERARLDHMHSTTRKGDVVLYVGAEEGEMCGLLALWGAKVVMFEPNERVLPNIKAIWKANHLPDPVIFAGFASSEDVGNPRTVIHTAMNLITGEIIGDHGFKELCDPGEIPQIRIDTYVEKTGAKPDMITMDVEGSEWEVLQGAEMTLRTFKPRIYLSLHPEFLINQYNKYSYEVRRWIIDLGYKETLLDYQHEVHLYYEATS